jgi:hypothetical protein
MVEGSSYPLNELAFHLLSRERVFVVTTSISFLLLTMQK